MVLKKQTAAEKQAEKDKPEGAIDPEDLVPGEKMVATVPDTRPKVKESSKSDVTSVAKEVIEGKWGVGQDRRLALHKAGYNVKDVDAAVRRLLNP